jgi:hypothetical protein
MNARHHLKQFLFLLTLMPGCFLGVTSLADSPNASLKFFGAGKLVELDLDGQQVVSTVASANAFNGFSILLFDGNDVREIPMDLVTYTNDLLIVQDKRQPFPKFTFQVTESPSQVKLELIRVEGVALGRDASLSFHLRSNVPLKIEAVPGQVEVKSDSASVNADWLFIGDLKPPPFGGFILSRLP